MEVFILMAVICAAIGFGIFWFGLFRSGAGGVLLMILAALLKGKDDE